MVISVQGRRMIDCGTGGELRRFSGDAGVCGVLMAHGKWKFLYKKQFTKRINPFCIHSLRAAPARLAVVSGKPLSSAGAECTIPEFMIQKSYI
jgi:hypothetical protein